MLRGSGTHWGGTGTHWGNTGTHCRGHWDTAGGSRTCWGHPRHIETVGTQTGQAQGGHRTHRGVKRTLRGLRHTGGTEMHWERLGHTGDPHQEKKLWAITPNFGTRMGGCPSQGEGSRGGCGGQPPAPSAPFWGAGGLLAAPFPPSSIYLFIYFAGFQTHYYSQGTKMVSVSSTG